jgi:hypothetical protein
MMSRIQTLSAHVADLLESGLTDKRGGSRLSRYQVLVDPRYAGAGARASTSVAEEHIFCPTMKAGQICTHGTAATLGVSDANNDKWVAWQGSTTRRSMPRRCSSVRSERDGFRVGSSREVCSAVRRLREDALFGHTLPRIKPLVASILTVRPIWL